MLGEIKIVPKDKIGEYEVTVNGREINEYVDHIEVKLEAGAIPRVVLDVPCRKIDLESHIAIPQMIQSHDMCKYCVHETESCSLEDACKGFVGKMVIDCEAKPEASDT